jgi:hypothetical protein
MKPFTKTASVLFGIGALIHVSRLFYPFRISIGGNEIPLMVSAGAMIIAAFLSYKLWKESNQ